MNTPRATFETAQDIFDAIYTNEKALLLSDLSKLASVGGYIDRLAYSDLCNEAARLDTLALRADLYAVGWTIEAFDNELFDRLHTFVTG